MSSLISDDFRLAGPRIEPITLIGEATLRILRCNDSDRLAERQEWVARGRYPTVPALARMRP